MQIRGQAFSLNTAYQQHKTNLARSMQRLSTGDRTSTPGHAPAADLSMSQRFRHRIARASASVNTIQRAMNYLNTATQYLDTAREMMHRMMELAATASDDLKSQADRDGLDLEYQALKAELTEMTRNAHWDGTQTVGRDTLVSYDGNTETIKFWLPDGSGADAITREFGSTDLDALNQEIGFDSSADYTMSRDGKSFFFLGTVTGDAAGVRRVKRYDIESGIVYTGSDLYDSADKLFVDQDGDLYLNDDGTLTTIDKSALTSTATAVTDLTADTEFSVSEGVAYYFRSTDNRMVSENIATSAVTTITAATTFAAGDHSFAASGRYAAEEDAAGQIRVIDLKTGNEATLAIGAANTVVNLQFNEDGDRIYYIDQTTNSIKYVSVRTDEADNVLLSTTGTKVVQGRNNNSFLGLDLGGANPSSSIKTIIAQDSPATYWYEAADIRLYALGLARSDIDSYTDANNAIEEVRTALTRINTAAAKIGASGVRFEYMLNTQREYIANMDKIESLIRDVDLAKESTEMSTQQVKMAAAQSVLAQFNNISRNVLALLQ